jgi:hypothetical protein
MRKLLFFIVLMVLGAVVYAQSTATLKLSDTDVTNLEPNDKVYVTIRVPDISANMISGFQFFIGHDESVISWDGSNGNPAPGIDWINPQFPLSAGAMFNVNPDQQLVFLWGDGSTMAQLNPGDSIIRFIFTYHGGESPIAWEDGPSGMVNEMYDENFDYYTLTFFHGCACMPNFDVTFHVTDFITTLDLEGATVTVDGYDPVVTDIAGLADFSLPNGEYTYAVTKTGYDTKSGSFTVDGAAQIIEVPLIPEGFGFAVTFMVTDEVSTPLAGAEVVLGGDVAVTNALGEAVFTRPNGTYSYTVTKYGYTTATGSVTVAGGPVTEPVVLTYLPHYDVTFVVTNLQSQPVEGALVDIEGVESALTNINGEAVFSMIDGDYNYSVTKENYVGTDGSFTVAGAPMTVPVTIAQLWDVTFHVTDGTINLPGAAVTINGETNYTGADGIAVFQLINGNYDYIVTKLNYIDETGNFNVTDSNMTIEVVMELITYPVVFTVTDGANPLQNAEVTVGTDVQYTDASGMTTFNLPDGFYSYTAILSCYYDEAGDFEVAGAGVNIPVVLSPMYFDITFHVFEEAAGTNIVDATVTITGVGSLQTNANGIAVFGLICGTYNYTVEKDGFVTETGTIVVASANLTIEVPMAIQYWTATFHVTDSATGANIAGATITIIGFPPPLVTDVNGIATIQLPDGVYTYSVIKDGYTPLLNQTFTVDGGDIQIPVEMSIVLWQVTFSCKLSGVGLPDVMVICNGDTVLTNAGGLAIFFLPDGTYGYEVQKFCFLTQTGTIIVNGTNLTKNIIMQYQPYNVTFVVTHLGEPVEGASVTLGTITLITPENGTVVFQKTNGTYNYTVTHPDYGTVEDEVTVDCADVTEPVFLDGIEDVTAASFSIYPNPSSGVFSITTSAVMSYKSDISVYDLTGKLVYTGKLMSAEKNEIDLSDQQPGMYILQIIVEDKVYNKTLIVQ